MATPSSTPVRNAPVIATVALSILGVVLLVVALVYFARPASALPSFFPGHTAGIARHHVTHGIAALLVGLLSLVGAWFSSGTRSATPRR